MASTASRRIGSRAAERGYVMTFGIDIATYQETLDVSDAVAAGTEFAGAKAVASYLPQLTVAEAYHSNIDDIIEAGLDHAKFHYTVPNSQNTPEATADFQWAIKYRYQPTDAFLLDNEPLDTYKVYWRDDDAARYFERLHTLGARYDQMWFYCPAALTRTSGPWPKMLALRAKGLKVMWVSYGDMDSLLEPGEEPFVGDTGFTDPELHQFTSAWTVPGWAGKVDRIHSRLTVGELFRGGTMEDQMRQYIAANKKPSDAATWDQMCGSLMFRFNSWRGWKTQPSRDISSAYRAGMNSGPLNTDLTRAPVGAFHFFDIAGAANGHVMQDARGGGLVCLSSGYSLSESLGNAIGFQSVPGYVAAKGARYMGWATNYAGGTINVSGLAGGGTRPIEEPIEEEEMKQAYVIVKREGDPARPWFSVVGAGSGVAPITSAAALRGVKKIVAAFRVDSDTPVEVGLSGEEWDAGTLDCFK
jgi:hypothetical protein